MAMEPLEEYLKQRKADHKLTLGEVVYLLDQEKKYYYKLIPTFVPFDANAWPYGKGAAAQRCIRAIHEEKVPYHFTYIKFYKTKKGYGPFALVAGKTNLRNPDFDFSTDITSSTDRGDQARRFLSPSAWAGYGWHCPCVLAVWSKAQDHKEDMLPSRVWSDQDRRARAVEKEIQKLLGLFSS